MAFLRLRIGFALRETGQALERVGCMFQGIKTFKEEISQHSSIQPSNLKAPSVSSTAWLAPNASVVGDVTVGDNTSLWYKCSVRGDNGAVCIGHNTNLQDAVTVGGVTPMARHTHIGSHVSIGHGAVVAAGCRVEDSVLIGMNAVLQDGVKVEPGAMIAAGAVVAEHTTIPRGELWGGNPARKLRELKEEEKTYIADLPGKYKELAAQHSQILDMARARMAQFQPPVDPGLVDAPPAAAPAAAAVAK